jgi:hypothetical protein
MTASQELLKEEKLAKMETKQERMEANQEKMDARTDANKEKFEVLQGTFASWMVIHQTRKMCSQEEMKAKMDICQEKMEAAIHSIQFKLEETIKHWVEDILSRVEQKTQGLYKELTEKIDETQVDL